MMNENEKAKKSLKELEEKAKELEKSAKKNIEHIEQDIRETLEESDREREEIVDELMTPPEEHDEHDEEEKVYEEEKLNEDVVDDMKYSSVVYEKGTFKYEPCKIAKHLNIVSKIVLVLAVISAIILAMQKQVIMTPFGGYAGYKWEPIALLYGLLSGFSGYVFYTVLNALSSLVENIDKNRQLKEFELRQKMEDYDI